MASDFSLPTRVSQAISAVGISFAHLNHRESFRDFLKALETTTAMKRRNISCTFCSDCAVSNLSLHGRCIPQSLQNFAKVVISRLLARNSCSLAVVVSASFASQ